jgi:hypothetical protein
MRGEGQAPGLVQDRGVAGAAGEGEGVGQRCQGGERPPG